LLRQTSLRIAAAQAQPVAGNVIANIVRTVELTALAIAAGAKRVLFPGKFLSGCEPDLIGTRGVLRTRRSIPCDPLQ
jgi:5-aminopentanamidase